MKSLVFKTAWQLNDKFSNFSQALKHAWALIKLKKAMLTKVVEFKYRKVDGSIRTAIGTLQSKFVDYDYKGQVSSNKVLAYFDIEQNSFRSFKQENLIVN